MAGLSLRAEMTLAELDQVEKGDKSLQQVLPKIRQELSYILNQAMDAARRIEAVRGVAEPGAGQSEPVDIASVFDQSLIAFKDRLSLAQVVLERHFADDLPLVRSNGKQLEIVFINLIKNALDSMDLIANKQSTHKLTVTAKAESDVVSISVRDTGRGISEKDIDRIFEPYFTTKGQKGTGMGLYLTNQIVQSHGGSIDVTSTEGEGTEFFVRLRKFIGKGTAAA